MGKHSSLFGQSVVDEERKYYGAGTRIGHGRSDSWTDCGTNLKNIDMVKAAIGQWIEPGNPY
jgi:hypothetical protein